MSAPNQPGQPIDSTPTTGGFALPNRPVSPLAAASGRGFVVCAAVAIGYGLWALYGSGERVASLDVSAAEHGGTPALFGPVALEPSMNPLRVVLHAAYTPTGSRRLRYEVELFDPAEQALWHRQGALGNRDDDASLVKTTTSLGDFDVAASGAYHARVRFDDAGMDDLREATLEVRRNVVRVDARLTWGFGLAALALLLVNLAVSRGQPWAYRPR